MQLKECYDAFGGNYEAVKERISRDEIIEKFLIKFLSEPSYDNLCKALEHGEYEEAFRASHSLKGVCANLGFDELFESSSVLTEYLRGKDDSQIDKEQCMKLLESVSKNYSLVIEALKGFVES